MNTYIGIDVGTTAIKIIAVNNQGVKKYQQQYSYSYLTPHKGWTEIMPEAWTMIMLEGLTELFQHIPEESVQAIGITGQMHTTVFLDQEGRALRPAIMWNDRRTKGMIPQIKRALAQTPETQAITQIVSNGSPLANLLWLKEQEPENYQKLAHVLITKDYLNYQLTGVFVTDYCDASTTSYYDLAQDTWSQAVFERYQFDPQWFPEIHPAAQIIGCLTEEICHEIGITKKIPVIAGTGDNVASTYATGSFNNKQPLISLGTSGVMIIPNDQHQLKKTGKNVVAKILASDQGIITQGTVQAGGKVNSWWLDTILQTNQYQVEQDAIPAALLGSNEVIFFPHLNGEKTLYANPNLRAGFVGLSLETTRQSIYLAVLEGLAFGIRTLYEAMRNVEEPEYFAIVGGGARSALWVKIFANVLNKPIKHILAASEAVDGVAAMAQLAITQKTQQVPEEAQLIYPTAELVKKYQQQYQNYQRASQLFQKYSEEVKSDEDLFNL